MRTLVIDPGVLTLLGLALPLLVGVVTRRVTSSGAKRAILAALSAVAGVLATVQASTDGVDVVQALVGALATYAAAQAGYSAVLKPSLIADLVAQGTDRLGIGLVVKPDPIKVAVSKGEITPAPTHVPVEQVVDTEGREAEIIADAEPGAARRDPDLLYPGDPGYEEALAEEDAMLAAEPDEAEPVTADADPAEQVDDSDYSLPFRPLQGGVYAVTSRKGVDYLVVRDGNAWSAYRRADDGWTKTSYGAPTLGEVKGKMRRRGIPT